MQRQKPSNAETPRSFCSLLQKMGDGSVNAHISKELQELTQNIDTRASETGMPQKGELNLKLSVMVDPHGNVRLDYALSTKIPTQKGSAGLMFVTPGGNLDSNKPDQENLPLQEVPSKHEVQV